ncbi:MAG: biotin transporter BioY [Candidatus Krumholzibacteria bacterium]|nr:biotin transporter BioY [Candidatus Krumholzibacteria bacterium]
MNSGNHIMTGAVSGILVGSGARRAARIFAFILFAAIGAQLAVRLPWTPVPVTMQTLFVVLAGIVLGPRDGFYAMIGYLSLGAAGAPVFAGFSFGPLVLVGPTGGYLLAFPAAALVAGAISAKSGRTLSGIFTGALCGTVLILLSGALYLIAMTGMSGRTALALGVTPFVAGGVLKVVAATVIARKR